MDNLGFFKGFSSNKAAKNPTEWYAAWEARLAKITQDLHEASQTDKPQNHDNIAKAYLELLSAIKIVEKHQSQ